MNLRDTWEVRWIGGGRKELASTPIVARLFSLIPLHHGDSVLGDWNRW